MLSVFLLLHIAGSFVFIGYVILALGMLVCGKGSAIFLRWGAVVIGVHQVITGLALSVVSPNMTLMTACVRGLVLVAVLYALSYSVSHRLAYLRKKVS